MRVEMLATPGTVRERRLAVVALRVATFSRDDTLSVKMLAVPGIVKDIILEVVALRVAILAKDDTLILAVVMAFDTNRLPVTCRFAVGVAEDPIPTCGM